MKILVVGNSNEAQQIRDNFQAQEVDAEVTCVSAYKHAIAALRSDQFDQVIVAQAKNLSLERQQAEIANLKRYQVPITLVGESNLLAQSVQVDLAPREAGYGTLIGNMMQVQALKSTERNRQLTQVEIKVATLEHFATNSISQLETLAAKLQELEIVLYGNAKNSGVVDDVRDLLREKTEQSEVLLKRNDHRLQYSLALIGGVIALLCALLPLIPLPQNGQTKITEPQFNLEYRDRDRPNRVD